MLLQELRATAGGEPTVLAETPWHDEASNAGSYRSRLQQFLGGFYEQDGATLQPKPERVDAGSSTVPDAVRLVDDGGRTIESYTLADLLKDTGLGVTTPQREDLEPR